MAVEQVETWRNLLESGSKVPNVYGIDVIWPGILGDNLVDLKAYLTEQELAPYFPELVRNNTVNGRLVALPFNLGEGLLFYWLDLLHRTATLHRPRHGMGLREWRRGFRLGSVPKGIRTFWGYVWQGAPSEALTCNALEWQVSEGGETILDENGRITVNNPQAIAAWVPNCFPVATRAPDRGEREAGECDRRVRQGDYLGSRCRAGIARFDNPSQLSRTGHRSLGQELATDSSKDQPPRFRVAVEGEIRDLHAILRHEIYKISAEALRNAFRHAKAGQIEVEIRYDREQF